MQRILLSLLLSLTSVVAECNNTIIGCEGGYGQVTLPSCSFTMPVITTLFSVPVSGVCTPFFYDIFPSEGSSIANSGMTNGSFSVAVRSLLDGNITYASCNFSLIVPPGCAEDCTVDLFSQPCPPSQMLNVCSFVIPDYATYVIPHMCIGINVTQNIATGQNLVLDSLGYKKRMNIVMKNATNPDDILNCTFTVEFVDNSLTLDCSNRTYSCGDTMPSPYQLAQSNCGLLSANYKVFLSSSISEYYVTNSSVKFKGYGDYNITLTALNYAGQFNSCSFTASVPGTAAVSGCQSTIGTFIDLQCGDPMPNLATYLNFDCTLVLSFSQSVAAGTYMNHGQSVVSYTVNSVPCQITVRVTGTLNFCPPYVDMSNKADDLSFLLNTLCGFASFNQILSAAYSGAKVGPVSYSATTFSGQVVNCNTIGMKCPDAATLADTAGCTKLMPNELLNFGASFPTPAGITLSMSPLAGTTLYKGVNQYTVTAMNGTDLYAKCMSTLTSTYTGLSTQFPSLQYNTCEVILPDYTKQTYFGYSFLCPQNAVVVQNPPPGTVARVIDFPLYSVINGSRWVFEFQLFYSINFSFTTELYDYRTLSTGIFMTPVQNVTVDCSPIILEQCSYVLPDFSNRTKGICGRPILYFVQSIQNGTALGPGNYTVVIRGSDIGATNFCDLPVNVVPPLQLNCSNISVLGVNYTLPDLSSRVSFCNLSYYFVQDPVAGSFLEVGIHEVNLNLTSPEWSQSQNCTIIVNVSINTNCSLASCPSSSTVVGCSTTIPDYSQECPGLFNQTISGTVSPGEYNVTISFVSNDTAVCSFTTIVVEPDPLALVVVSNVTASCTYEVNSSYILSLTGGCGTVTVNQIPPVGTIFEFGKSIITTTVSDSYGVTITNVTEVDVQDLIPPVIVCPSDQILQLCNWTVPQYPVTATDDCKLLYFVQNPPAGQLVSLGINLVTLVAVDIGLNYVSCTFSVTLQDLELPTLDCSDVMVSGCPYEVPSFSYKVTDNCPNVQSAQTIAAGSEIAVSGTYSVILSGIDSSGNINVCTFNLIVVC